MKLITTFVPVVCGILTVLSFQPVLANVLPPSPVQLEEEARLRTLKRFGVSDSAASGRSRTSKRVVSEHLLFADNASAIAWIKSQKMALSAALGTDRFDVLERDERYDVLRAYVHEVWVAFTQLFPEETRNLNEPPVVLVSTESRNAFVSKDLATGKIGHAIVVFTGYLDEVGGVQQRATIIGTFAHELAHSVFKHVLLQYQPKYSKFVISESGQLGFEGVRSPERDSLMETWTSYAGQVGDLTFSQLHHLPSPGAGKPFLERIWIQMRRSFEDGSINCQTARARYNTWYDLFSESGFESAYSVPSGMLPLLETSSLALISSQSACFRGKRKRFSELFTEATGIPASLVETNPAFSQLVSRFDTNEEQLSVLRSFVDAERRQMTNVEAAVDFSKLTYYSFEEHADDVSAIVLAYLGLDPEACSAFYWKLLGNDRNRCMNLIRGNQTIPAGSFSGPHRSNCYRIDHLARLAKKLRGGPEAVARFAREYMEKALR